MLILMVQHESWRVLGTSRLYIKITGQNRTIKGFLAGMERRVIYFLCSLISGLYDALYGSLGLSSVTIT